MSGILLPGQENTPPPEEENKSSSGIALPDSFRRRQERAQEQKKSETPQPAAEQTPASGTAATGAAATSADDAAGADDRQPGQPNFLFPPRGAQIQCPNCGTTYVVPIFNIVDFGANPELRPALLGNQINVASCTNCGVGGPLSVPLLIHDPDNEFLGIFAPQQGGNELNQQREIGNLQQTLMRKIPNEQRRGYMLQPRQFMDWQRLMEKMWEFEGVAPETLRRQSEQSELLQRIVGLASDESALKIAVERSKHLIDRDFFGMLEQVMMMSGAQGQNAAAEQLVALREKLLDMTEVGKEVREQENYVRSILENLGARPSRDELLTTIVDEWMKDGGDDVVATIAMAAAPLLDYEFLMALSGRIDAEENEETKEKLNVLREFIVSVQDQQRQQAQAATQGMQQFVQQILQADDTEATLREQAQYIDETLLRFLAGQIQAAQQQNATAAVRRLTQVYEQAIAIYQEALPPEVRLLQQLVSAPDEASSRQLLQENKEMFTAEFVQQMKTVEEQMRQAGNTAIADRVKSLRGQIALMA